MAVVKFIASGCPMNHIFHYVMREEATDRGLIDGIGCSPETAMEEFRFVKERFHKEDGRQYYHIVQSFSPKDDLTPETAHEIGMRFAGFFDGYQALVATHVNTAHLHNHIILNSVSFRTGYKYHQSRDEMLKAKRCSNELSRQYGLSVTEEKCEYGETPRWKEKLKKVLLWSLSVSPDRAFFIREMRLHGYGVTWEEGHKHVTFQTPEGYRCRDNKLFDDRFLRCNMDIYFTMGGCASPAGSRYLSFDMPSHEAKANMTIGNELIFLMADIFRGDRKKTKEEIEAEERARDTEAAMGIFLAAVLLAAEQYRNGWTEHPERFGLRPRGYDQGPRLVM